MGGVARLKTGFLRAFREPFERLLWQVRNGEANTKCPSGLP